MTVTERLAAAKQAEYLSLNDCALLLNVSKATIRRRLPALVALHGVIQTKRIVRVKRVTLMRLVTYAGDGS